MTEPTTSEYDIFLPDDADPDAHIVDVLIEERCPSFVAHPTWPMMRPVLYKMLGYRRAVEMADLVQTMSGPEAFDYLARELAFSAIVNHLERVPAHGKVIIASNHPTGLADGVVVWDVLKKRREDIQFLANADAIRVSENLGETIIPVEWVLEKRSPAKAKDTLRRSKEAFEQDKCLVIFPSGKLARKEKGKLTEQSWFPTVVTLARKQNVPVVPLNLKGANSWLFYFLGDVNGQLRDITLFYELLNKKGAKFELTFGPLIQPDELKGDAQAMTETLRRYVSEVLAEKPDLAFSDWKAGLSGSSA